jgi:hypothetical protein
LQSNIAVSNSGSSQISITASGVTQSGNSWNSGSWSDKSFKSIDSSGLKGARGADGRIPASDFLLPADGAAIGATTRSKV